LHQKENIAMVHQAVVLPLILSTVLLFGQNIPQKRVLTICALNDANLSLQKNVRVKKRTIDRIVREVSREYARNVNISLKLVEYHDTLIPISPLSGKPEGQLRGACEKGEVVAVFSNQKNSDEFNNSFFGWSDKQYGILWDYRVASRIRQRKRLAKFKDLAVTLIRHHAFAWGETKTGPETTFKHELAHLFLVEHSKRNTDFMYPYGDETTRWSNRVRDDIQKNRNRTWDDP
jgi:hypothetical protein